MRCARSSTKVLIFYERTTGNQFCIIIFSSWLSRWLLSIGIFIAVAVDIQPLHVISLLKMSYFVLKICSPVFFLFSSFRRNERRRGRKKRSKTIAFMQSRRFTLVKWIEWNRCLWSEMKWCYVDKIWIAYSIVVSSSFFLRSHLTVSEPSVAGKTLVAHLYGLVSKRCRIDWKANMEAIIHDENLFAEALFGIFGTHAHIVCHNPLRI